MLKIVQSDYELIYKSSGLISIFLLHRNTEVMSKSISILIVRMLLVLVKAASDDCPCIDSASSPLASLANCRIHETDTSNTGILINEVCYPITYGTSTCNAYDRAYNPLCASNNPPKYCNDQWCFVDFEKCRTSDKMIRKSDMFPELNNLFYSYDT